MGTPDEIIHQSLRLRVMATLNAHGPGERLDFTRLRDMLGASDGNLGAHLTTLENAGYVDIDKSFVGKKPRTRIAITRKGQAAFAAHTAYLKSIIEAAMP